MTTALLIVDVQHDFLPGGALGVPHGDEVVEPLLRARAAADVVVMSRDAHPADHCSFTAQGGTWPPHCVEGTPGAELEPRIAAGGADLVVAKATRSDADAYSAFDGTGLTSWLRDRGVERVLVGGLATDYCVRASALDALASGFQVVVLTDAVRGVDVEEGDADRALGELAAAGATLATVSDLGDG